MNLIKGFVKEGVSKVVSTRASDIHLDELLEYECISFDIFDTLIVRNCAHPTDVFDIVEKRFNAANPIGGIRRFKRMRIQAEEEARSKSSREEITLDDIYRELQQIYGPRVNELHKLEISTEADVCCANHQMLLLYNTLLELNKRVLLISDMYLPQSVVEHLLERCGITGYEKLYLSSEIGFTKASGKLFDFVVKEIEIDVHQMIHMGDSLQADYLNPKDKGITAVLYSRGSKFSRYYTWNRFDRDIQLNADDWLSLNILQSLSRNKRHVHDGSLRGDVGFNVLGPLLFGYCVWLHDIAVKKKISKILFLAREGDLLSRAYNTLYPDSELECRYVYISRLAVSRASAIGAKSIKDLTELFYSNLRGATNLGAFIELLGITVPDTELKRIGYSRETSLSAIGESDQLFCVIMKYGNTYFKQQNDLFIRYMSSDDNEGADVVLADIGWSGTMQVMLKKMIPELTTYGVYLAVSDFANTDEYNDILRYGYWCDNYEWKAKGSSIRFAQSAIETMFMNSEGSTVGYATENGKIVPVKTTNSIGSIETIQDMQANALKFVKECARAGLRDTPELITRKSCMIPFINFADYPDYRTIELFKGLAFENGSYTIGFLAKESLWDYLKRPKEFVHEFHMNTSKVIWLKSLFKIPMPYFAVCKATSDMVSLKSSDEM